MGHFVSSPREREKIDRRDSRRDEREGQGRKRNRNESEETEVWPLGSGVEANNRFSRWQQSWISYRNNCYF